jgi:hypothetical protein
VSTGARASVNQQKPRLVARNLPYGEGGGSGTTFEENSMLWTIIVILLVLWLLGLIGGIGGNLIYLLLVIAAIVLLFQLLSGRRSV